MTLLHEIAGLTCSNAALWYFALVPPHFPQVVMLIKTASDSAWVASSALLSQTQAAVRLS